MTLALTALLLLLQQLPDTFRSGAWLDRSQPLQLWRVFSAHWIHSGNDHLLWNTAGLLLLGSLCEQRARSYLLEGLLVGMLGVGVWFVCFGPTDLYCGLSGALNTLLMYALAPYWQEARRTSDPVARLLIALILLIACSKVASELLLERSWLAIGEWHSTPGAHGAGIFAGLLGLLLRPRPRNAPAAAGFQG